jgi:delta1-piperideine-2-carboxylate reductase
MAARPAARLETLIDEIHDAGQSRLPGDRRYANRRAAEQHGIPLSDADYAELVRLSES